jgi:mycofactocin system FadH/OYE family oxidoreductase 2
MSSFKYLFMPLQLGKLTIKNRIVFPAHMTNFGREGKLTSQHIAYYTRRARGGAGLIITEEQSVHPSDHPYEKLIRAYKPEIVSSYNKLTREVHRYGAKIFAQLNHNGSQGSGMYTGRELWAPSPVPDPIFKEVPKAMEEEDIGEVLAGYARVAGYVVKGGFDGIEIQASHSSLIRQFLSRTTNSRKDSYGGDFNNRLKFLLEVLQSIRKAVGEDYCVGVRLCVDEFVEGGLTIEDTQQVVVALEKSSMADYINTSLANFHNLFLVEGSMRMPLGYTVYLASSLRRVVTLPVFAVGRINDPFQAEQILSDGHADMVGIVRGQICDPDFSHKARAEQFDDIRKCIACNQCCAGRMGLNFTLGCLQNPEAGEEENNRCVRTPFRKRRTVHVIGGGPGGMEAAKIIAENGDRVILHEKGTVLGGQVTLFSKVPGREEFADLTRNQLFQLQKLRVEIELEEEIDESKALSWKDATIILATGSRPLPPPFKVDDNANVFDVRVFLGGGVEVGERVLVVDLTNFHPGTSIAEWLLEQGKEVYLATPALYAGSGLGPTQDLPLWYRNACRKGMHIINDVIVNEVKEKRVALMDHYCGREIILEDIDSVVVAGHSIANDELYNLLKGKVKELYRIGDCLAPRRVENAILDAHHLANRRKR